MYSEEISNVVLPASAIELSRVSWSGPVGSVAMDGGNQITITGWPQIACGAALAVAGGGVMDSASLWPPSAIGAPAWVIPAVGLFFAALGLYITIDGASGLRQKRMIEGRKRSMPDQPWLWDHEWREDGIGGDTGAKTAKAFGFALVSLVFLVPFHWIFFVVKEIPWVFGVGLVIGDLVVVGVIASGVSLIRMRRRYGDSWLHFRRFPFRTGERLEATLDATAGRSDLPSLKVTLRCVQERYELRGMDIHHKELQVIPYALWSASARVQRSVRRTFDFQFDIPAEAPSSLLGEQPPRYWELIVDSDDVPGADFHARFLVPVYRGRQGAQAKFVN